jgi:hypothetical protein
MVDWLSHPRPAADLEIGALRVVDGDNVLLGVVVWEWLRSPQARR